MKSKLLITTFLVATALCGCTSRVQKEVTVLPEETEITETVSEQRIVYDLQFDELEVFMLSDDRIAPVDETYDSDLYRACKDPIVFWCDSTEVFITTEVFDTDCNYTQIGDMYFLTRNTEFDFSVFESLLTEKISDDKVVIVEACELNPTGEDDLYADIFPDYNESNVYSYAKAELSDGTPVAILQRVTENGIEYEYLGIDADECEITAYAQLIVGDSEEVIELDFYANPNYTPN